MLLSISDLFIDMCGATNRMCSGANETSDFGRYYHNNYPDRSNERVKYMGLGVFFVEFIS
jgi:hypothetical protein